MSPYMVKISDDRLDIKTGMLTYMLTISFYKSLFEKPASNCDWVSKASPDNVPTTESFWQLGFNKSCFLGLTKMR